MDVNQSDQISDVRLLHEKIEPITSLNGFEKHFRVPQAANSTDLQFLARVSEADVDAELQKTFSKLRSAYGFKRKEMLVDGPVDGGGTIATPFFNYEVNVTFLEDDPSRIAWKTSVADIRLPEQIFTEGFHKSFGNRFSILEVSTTAALDLESIVDHVEAIELDSVSVNYDKDVTWCEIRIADTDASVRICENSIRVASRNEISPQELLESFLDIQRQFLATLNCAGNPFLVDT